MLDTAIQSADYTPKGGPVIVIAPHGGLVRVKLGGEIVAETRRALSLTEGTYPLRLYVPRADARMDLLKRSGHTSHCPWKGDAAYFHIEAGGKLAENAVWTYEAPLPGVAAIAGHLAFYAERVDGIEVAA